MLQTILLGRADLKAWTGGLAHPPISDATIQPAPVTATMQAKMNARDFKTSNVNCIAMFSLLGNAATTIAVILFGDDNLSQALTQTAVVVGSFLRVANIHVVQLNRPAGAHLFEGVFLVDPDFVDRGSDCFSRAFASCEIEAA